VKTIFLYHKGTTFEGKTKIENLEKSGEKKGEKESKKKEREAHPEICFHPQKKIVNLHN
jgi:hypothetical protein